MQQPITIMSVNVGHFNKLMDNEGLTPNLIAFLQNNTSDVICFQETRATNEDIQRLSLFLLPAKYIHATHSAKTNKNAGVAMYVKEGIHPMSKWRQNDTISIDIALQNTTVRLTVISTYIHFKDMSLGAADDCLLQGCLKLAADNIVVIIGDLNCGINPANTGQVYRPWHQKMTLSPFRRLLPPQASPTSLQGQGTAIGVLSTAAGNRLIYESFKTHNLPIPLSNAHKPISITLPAKALVGTTDHPSIARRHPLPTLEQASDQAQDYTSLLDIIYRNTALNAPHRERKGHALLKHLRLTASRTLTQLSQSLINNPRRIIMLLTGPPTTDPLPLDTNTTWAEALEDIRWAPNPVDIPAVHNLFLAAKALPPATLALILQPITVSDILHAKGKWQHNKCFSDFKVEVLTTLSPHALQLLATELSTWFTNYPPRNRLLIGLRKPNQRPRDEEETQREFLLRILRPIGIAPATHALFMGIFSHRLSIACESNGVFCDATTGFRPGRSTHQIIIQTLMALHAARCGGKAFFLIKSDIAKAYDRTPLSTQMETAQAIGLGVTVNSIIASHTSCPIAVHATSGPPGVATPRCGHTQGEAPVCQFFPLNIEPAVSRAEQRARCIDSNMLLTSHCQFADDGITTDTQLQRLLTNFHLFANDIETLGFTISKVEITANAKGRFFHKTAIILGQERPIKMSTRILGACIHMDEPAEGPCADHHCSICKGPTTYPLCAQCLISLSSGIKTWRESPASKAAIITQQVYPALCYAPYSCTAQHEFAIAAYKLLWRALTMLNHQGLEAYTNLPTALGGIGLPNMGHHIASHTVRTLTRELQPTTHQARTAGTLIANLTGGNFSALPPQIRAALGPFTLEANLYLQTQTSKAIYFHLRQQTTVLKEHLTHVRQYSTEQLPIEFTIVMRDEIKPRPKILELYVAARLVAMYPKYRITFVNCSQSLLTDVNVYNRKDPRKRIREPQSTELQYLCFPTVRVHLWEDTPPTIKTIYQDTVFLPGGAKTAFEWFYNTPILTYPLALRYNGLPCATDAHSFTKNIFEEQYKHDICAATQYSPLMMHPSWETSGYSLYYKHFGAKYQTTLPMSDILLAHALRSAGACHEGDICTHPYCLTPDELSIHHIWQHLSQETLTDIGATVNAIYSTTMQSVPIPPQLLVPAISNSLGWTTGDYGPLLRASDTKELRYRLHTIMVAHMQPFLATARLCLGISHEGHTPIETPHNQVTPPETPAEWKLQSDASLASNGLRGGIGGVIVFKGIKVLEIWAPVVKDEKTDITTIEYEAIHFLLTAAKIFFRNNLPLAPNTAVDIESDNQIAVKQSHHAWHTKNLGHLNAKKLTLDLLRQLKEEHQLSTRLNWIPRTQNRLADAAASRGANAENKGAWTHPEYIPASYW